MALGPVLTRRLWCSHTFCAQPSTCLEFRTHVMLLSIPKRFRAYESLKPYSYRARNPTLRSTCIEPCRTLIKAHQAWLCPTDAMGYGNVKVEGKGSMALLGLSVYRYAYIYTHTLCIVLYACMYFCIYIYVYDHMYMHAYNIYI